jgi:hypothetical protein
MGGQKNLHKDSGSKIYTGIARSQLRAGYTVDININVCYNLATLVGYLHTEYDSFFSTESGYMGDVTKVA